MLNVIYKNHKRVYIVLLTIILAKILYIVYYKLYSLRIYNISGFFFFFFDRIYLHGCSISRLTNFQVIIHDHRHIFSSDIDCTELHAIEVRLKQNIKDLHLL